MKNRSVSRLIYKMRHFIIIQKCSLEEMKSIPAVQKQTK